MSIFAKTTPFAVAVAVLLTGTATKAADMAQEPVPVAEAEPPDGTWVFSVAPYFWAAGLSGDVGLFGRQPVNIDMSFGDIFDNLRFAGMAVGEAHNGTWGILADVIYINIKAEEAVARTVGNIPLELSGSVETTSFTGTVMGQYRAIAQPRATLDLMAGVRVWSVENDISLSLAAGGPPLAAFSGSDGSTWIDPMVGLKGRFDFNPSWYVTGWGLVGGGESKVSWDVLASVGYQWNDRISIVGGYRALGVDYENDGFVYDVVQQGPIFGAVFKF